VDLNSFLPVVLKLLSSFNQTTPNNINLNQEVPTNEPSITNFNDAFFQLPNYNFNEQKSQKNTQNANKTNFDINNILEIIKILSKLFPQKNKKEENTQADIKEDYPSYISSLTRTDKYNFE